jgi:hypothetical protein
LDSPPDSFPRWDHHTSPGYPAAFPESWWAILARASVPRSSHGWVHSEPPPVGQSRYRSLQCRRRSRPPASGISYCRPPLDLLLSSDRFSSATKRAASPQRQNQCHDASREALCSANWGGPLHKQNSYRHHDQGFYAGHGNTETNLAHNSLRLELGLLASHGVSPTPSQPQWTTREPGESFRFQSTIK